MGKKRFFSHFFSLHPSFQATIIPPTILPTIGLPGCFGVLRARGQDDTIIKSTYHMNQRSKTMIICAGGMVVLVGLAGCIGLPPRTAETSSASFQTGYPPLDAIITTNAPTTIPGTGSNSCVGLYNGFARFTNTAVTPSSIWFRPPTGTAQATITDASGITGSFVPVLEAIRRRDLFRWCGTNTKTFPATSSDQYQFSTYVKNPPPPPAAGQILSVTIQWH